MFFRRNTQTDNVAYILYLEQDGERGIFANAGPRTWVHH